MNAAALPAYNSPITPRAKPADDASGDLWDHRRQVAKTVLGSTIDWIDEVTGFLDCPGIESHTAPNGRKDCRIKVDGAPTISCFHQSCQEQIVEANRELRRAIGSRPFGGAYTQASPAAGSAGLKSESRQGQDDREESEALALQAKVGLAQILDEYSTPPHRWVTISPEPISPKPPGHWRQLLSLYRSDDVIWVGGEVWESSATDSRFERNFRTVADWLPEQFCQGKFTCPSVFKPGVHSRNNENVIRRPFLVVESDVLTKTQAGAVFNWMRGFLTLRAVVDTAGKSLHGWFDFPDQGTERELRIILPALGCDPALFKPSQPCRLPGAMRNGRFQHLLYLDLKGVTK